MTTTALTTIDHQDVANLMPIMRLDVAIERRNQMVQFVHEIMIADTDYGTVPGSDKPTLLKPGAERLKTFFGLSNRFETETVEEDWTGERHHGEPFFYYLEKCRLFRGDVPIGEASGSCNSWESKYRYRKAERVCPACGIAAIVKGRQEYGGGWLCFAKRGGCGAKFRIGDPEIESQQVGRVINPDVADLVNTVKKMAQKRALVAAVLIAVNASEFFTQDIEDLATSASANMEGEPDTAGAIDVQPSEAPRGKASLPRLPAEPHRQPADPADVSRQELWRLWYERAEIAAKEHIVFKDVASDISDDDLKKAIKDLAKRIKEVREAAALAEQLS